MLNYAFIIRRISIILLLLAVSGCRKEIDYTESNSQSTGPLDPTEPYYELWEDVSPNLVGINNICNVPANHSDPNLLLFTRKYYYNSSWKSDIFYLHPNGSYSNAIDQYPYQIEAIFSSPNDTTTAAYVTSNDAVVVIAFGENINPEFGIEQLDEYWTLNDIVTNGNEIYVAGRFDYGVSDNIFSIDPSTNQSTNLDGINGTIRGIEFYNNTVYACGFNMSASGSVIFWNGTGWESHPANITGNVSDITFYNDELFVAGDNSSGSDVSRYSNGQWINYSELINTSPNSSGGIQFIQNDGELYAYGNLEITGSNIHGLVQYKNGTWDFVGSLPEDALDVDFAGDYAYALLEDNKIYRLKIK